MALQPITRAPPKFYLHVDLEPQYYTQFCGMKGGLTPAKAIHRLENASARDFGSLNGWKTLLSRLSKHPTTSF